MKLKTSRPRNPLVQLMRSRNGEGVHQKSGKALRQAAKRQLRRLKDEAGFAQRIKAAH
ncbi:hypothetical protein Q9Q94_07320 [Uliginosibacterium sp. 31-16]|uniref:hypothetical protein n=1 Tax=Uliginosibacterium sp. 31-16 TaxID=3068315 RepID=UPI00273F2D8A|nr:hypothetical protein [Uliginosibacterium sp. 31-16]MDP5239334.1 hypothetical protein [Uliginosibacterium sp. 31-16]